MSHPIISSNTLSSITSHSIGITDVSFFNQNIITSGSDGNLNLYEYNNNTFDLIKCEAKENEIVSLSIHPKGNLIALASISSDIVCHTLPELNFDMIVTQFSTTGKFVYFCPNNDWLACCAEDGSIKLIDTNETTTIMTCRSEKSYPIKSLAIDPAFHFLSAADGNGYIHIWALPETGNTPKLLRSSLYFTPNQNIVPLTSFKNNGEILAAPSSKGVLLFEKSTSFLTPMKIQFLDSIGTTYAVKWSLNGEYLAVVQENKILVLDMRDIVNPYIMSELDVEPNSFAWSQDDTIAVIDQNGKLYMWDSVIQLKKPAATEKKEVESGSRLTKFSTLEKLDEEEETQQVKEPEEEEITEEEMAEIREMNEVRHEAGNLGEYEPTPDSMRSSMLQFFRTTIEKELLPELQKSFQSGATPMLENSSQCFLAWNNIGSIALRQLEDNDVVDIQFSDSSRRPHRIQLQYSFDFGSLSNTCSIVGASIASNPDSTSAIVVVSQFDFWNGRGEWLVRLDEGDDLVCVAAGNKFAAVGTLNRYVRIFSYAGIQRGLFCVTGDIVTMTASNLTDMMAVVYHGSASRPGEQNLRISLVRVQLQNESPDFAFGFRLVADFALPLSPSIEKSKPTALTWIQFCDNGSLVYVDSTQRLRLISGAMNNLVIPLISFSTLCKSPKEKVWPIDIVQNQLLYTINSDGYPVIHPKPLVTLAPISMPLLVPTSEVAQLENQCLMSNLWISESTLSHDDSEFKKELLNSDKNLIKAVGLACQNGAADGKLMKAFEYACFMHTPKCVQLSKMVAEKVNAHQLAEKIQRLFEIKTDVETEKVNSKFANTTFEQYMDKNNSNVEFKDLPASPMDSQSDSQIPMSLPSNGKKRLSDQLMNSAIKPKQQSNDTPMMSKQPKFNSQEGQKGNPFSKTPLPKSNIRK